MSEVVIRPIEAEASRPIRHEVLRRGLPFGQTALEGDDDPDTFHAGAFVDGELVAVGRVSREPPPGSDDAGAWRLRGMATLEAYRGRGLGRAILDACLEHAAARGGREVWCNARVRARPFYERAGFRAEGEVFDVADIGPHVRMRRGLEPGGA